MTTDDFRTRMVSGRLARPQSYGSSKITVQHNTMKRWVACNVVLESMDDNETQSSQTRDVYLYQAGTILL